MLHEIENKMFYLLHFEGLKADEHTIFNHTELCKRKGLQNKRKNRVLYKKIDFPLYLAANHDLQIVNVAYR